jgi:tetratricopeptide (TPR) repeat protein
VAAPAAPTPAAAAPAAAAASPVSALAVAPPASAPRRATAPTQPVLDKLAAGDRALAAGDLRGALFAFQDAVYAQPSYPFARVKLGRAYLALRYSALAAAQADEALALDPASPDALELAKAARSPMPPRPAPAAELVPASSSLPVNARAAAVRTEGPPSEGPRVYRLADPTELAPDAAPAAAAPAPTAAPRSGSSAAQRYRAGVELFSRREYRSAVAELDQAIALDPYLAAAYTARASAHFGLGSTRAAAEDYQEALSLDPAVATPLYGLAECYRVLGHPAAAELYERYSRSRAADVREDLRASAERRARELGRR